VASGKIHIILNHNPIWPVHLEDGNDFLKARKLALIQLSSVLQNQHKYNMNTMVPTSPASQVFPNTHSSTFSTWLSTEIPTNFAYPLKQNVFPPFL
jgi:hypothetical protein